MIIYETEALDDLQRLRAWFSEREVLRAEAEFLVVLKRAEERIAATPHAWPFSHVFGTRRYLMRFGRSTYVIHYVEDGADQIIVRLWHGRENRA